MVEAYSLLAIASLGIFGILHVLSQDQPLIGYLELAGVAAIALNLLGLRLTQNIFLAQQGLLLSIFVLLAAMLLTGGTNGTGIFWYFVFPLCAFFIAGRRQGIVWMTALFVTTSVVWLLGELGYADVPYSAVEIRQLLITLLVLSVGIYTYQRTREQAQTEATSTRHDLQEYLDMMTTFSAKIDPEGTIVFANKVAKQASGLGEDLIGASFLDGAWWAYDPAVQQRVSEAFSRVLGGQPVNYDEQLQIDTPRGPTTITINFGMVPLLQDGEVRYVLAEARDITAEQEVDRAKSELVTLASHQLRTPISAISWFSEMLLHGDAGKLKPEQKEYIQQIKQSNERSASMVDAMLTVSRLELDTLPVRPTPCNVAEVVHEVVELRLRRQEHMAKHLTVQEEYEQKLPIIQCDRDLLKTILHNIIANAIKYTPAAGAVTVKVAMSRRKLHAGSKGSLAISVQDTGYGIPKKQQSQVFAKLFRASNIKTKDTDGTGLGLYIVKTILSKTTGDITLESEENKGSTFTIFLPLEGMPATQNVTNQEAPREESQPSH